MSEEFKIKLFDLFCYALDNKIAVTSFFSKDNVRLIQFRNILGDGEYTQVRTDDFVDADINSIYNVMEEWSLNNAENLRLEKIAEQAKSKLTKEELEVLTNSIKQS